MTSYVSTSRNSNEDTSYWHIIGGMKQLESESLDEKRKSISPVKYLTILYEGTK